MTAGDLSSPVFDFTSLDYASNQADLIRYAQVTFPTSIWTNFNPSNPATYLLQLMSYATDLLAYNINSSINEAIPVNCVRTQNFINLAQTFNYTMYGPAPSNTTLTFTLNPSGTYPTILSRHTQCTTSDGTVFQPNADTNVSSYTATITVNATQGKEYFQQVVGVSNGLPGQQVTLPNYPIIDGSLQMVVGGTLYSLSPNVVASGPTDTVYLQSVDENGQVTLTFGDGINGITPPVGASFVATYYVGGGLNTNYPVNTIVNILSTQADGNPVPNAFLSVTNSTAAEDGAPAQTLQNAQQTLPLVIKANDRCVTLQDYAATAVNLVAGISTANAIAGIPVGGTTPVWILAVPVGGGSVTPVLANQIVQALTNGTSSDPGGKKMAGKRIQVFTPVYVSLHIEAAITVKNTAVALTVLSRVSSVLLNEYSISNSTFSETLELQAAYELVAPTEVDGVSSVLIKKFTIDPYFSPYLLIPVTGTGSVEFINTTAGVNAREWSITVIAPTVGFTCNQFTVLQRQTGTITTLTDNSITDESASYPSNSLVGQTLQPNPQTSPTSITITGNSGQEITVASGLFSVASPGDPYAVNYTEPRIGKILTATLSSNVSSGATVLPFTSVVNWSNGDKLYIVDSNTGNVLITGIQSISGSNVTVTSPTPSAFASATTTIYYYWASNDGSVQFAVVDDLSGHLFVPGDTFYVATFAPASDITLRPENFPTLVPSDLILNTIGGIN